MAKRLKTVFSRIRADGPAAAAAWVLRTLYFRIIPQKQVVWCTDLADYVPDTAIPETITFKRIPAFHDLDEADYETLVGRSSELMGMSQCAFIRKKFDQGAVLWLIMAQGRLAGYRWTLFHDRVSSSVFFPHSEGDVHSVGAELYPDFRGKNIYQMSNTYLKSTLKNEGYRRLLSETYVWNKRAIRALLKEGNRPVGIATKFRLGNTMIVIWHDRTGETLQEAERIEK